MCAQCLICLALALSIERFIEVVTTGDPVPAYDVYASDLQQAFCRVVRHAMHECVVWHQAIWQALALLSASTCALADGV